jgi:hypothetical protein
LVDDLLCSGADVDLCPGIQLVYIRQHYRKLLDVINLEPQKDRACLTALLGTPGVGKSVFAM